MKITINALDTLTFGVGKPSVWGEDTFGAGMFPPFPSVVRGAARTAWLCENGSVEMADTDEDPTKKYAITEYALLLDGEPHFPVPADCLIDGNGKLVQCKLKENDGLSNLADPCQLYAETDGKISKISKISSAEGRYVSKSELQRYLDGGTLSCCVPLSDYITDESKIGIFKERGRGTVKEGMLYRLPLTRPATAQKNASLAANIEGMDEIPGLTRFGGENKVANFTGYGGGISPCGNIGEDGSFKLYIATPAIFKGGFKPPVPDCAELLAAAVCGYDSVGGFDMKNRRPKPMRRAVRAGSVFYYELTQNTPANREAILGLHGSSIGDFSREDGFGICYVGKI